MQRQIRRLLWVLLVAAAVGAAVVPSVLHLRSFAEDQQAAHRLSVAHKLHVPDGLTPLRRDRTGCPGRTVVRCARTSDPHVDALARQSQHYLSRASGQAATVHCSDGRPSGTVPRRSCDVQVFGGRISVSISTRVRLAGRTIVPDGATYRVDAS